ncbi:hypothetical protein ALC60_00959 [Trachymyrmex zeteki]|uniref:DDE-1 domain-containing protein n=1 Tax=Mycetomoellerius zeteki TaxID=64791 RepID=A0A151XI75_9HYME|nr:hypothetical protein ALC60_00959 [Trachymyrmex zeteki]
MTQAKEHIAAGNSVKAAVQVVGACEATLRKRLKEGTVPLNLDRLKSSFSTEEEEALVKWVKIIDDTFYGVSKKQLMDIVYQYAEHNNISHNFNHEKQMVREKWIRDLSVKYRLTLQRPEKCSGSVIRFSKIHFEKFHDNLKRILEENPELNASRIYNMDESNISTIFNKFPKIVLSECKCLGSKIVSQSRILSLTAVCCMSAAGYYVPPALIFPRKKFKPEFCKRAPPNTLGMTSDSGSINSELFVTWLKHFTKYVTASRDRPVLLVLDNHISHCSLPAINYCQENGIILLVLPPYASHKLQPLEIVFFGSLKKFMAEECDRLILQPSGRLITIYQIGEIFCTAYHKATSIDEAIKAFRDTGIFPQNPFAFREEDFMPASLTKKQSIKHPEDNKLVSLKTQS